MAFDVGELFAGISLDDAKYQAGLRKVKQDGEAVERKGIKPKVDIDTTAATSKLGRLGVLIDQNSAKLKSVGRDMTVGVTLPIVAAGIASVKLAGDLEQSRIAFETMLGSADKADSFIKTLQDFAKTTPFEYTDLVEQTKRLMAYGFAAEDIVPMLTKVGDATAALGSGAAGLDAITRAMGQIQAKGKLSAEEMRQLSEAGVPAWQMLADAMHVSVQQVMKDAEQGRISADQAITAILEGMDARYAGLMEKQSKTILGQFANLIDELKITAAEFGLAMKPFIEPALGIFKGMLEVVSALPAPLKAVIGVLGTIVAVVGPSLWALGRAAEGFRALKDLWGFFRPAKVAADTAAVSANTAAVEANTIARNKNALTPPVGSSGVAPAAPQLARGAAGASGLGAAVAPGVASAAIGAATIGAGAAVYFLGYKPYKEALDQQQEALDGYSENVVNRIDMLKVKYGEGSSQIREYARIVNEDLTNMEESHQNWWTRGMNWTYGPLGLDLKLGGLGEQDARVKAIVEEVQGILAAGPVQSGSSTEARLRKLFKELSSIKDPSDAAKKAIAAIGAELEALAPGALMTAAESAELVAANAEAAAKEVRQLASQFENLEDVARWIGTLSLAELNEQMGTLGQLMAEVSGATARTKAAKMLKKRYKGGIDWSQVPDTPGADLAAGVKDSGSGIPDWADRPAVKKKANRVKKAAQGVDFTTNGPELLLVGDNPSGREHVKVTPSEAGGGGPAVSLVVKIGQVVGTDSRAAERLAGMVGDVLVPRVLDALAVS